MKKYIYTLVIIFIFLITPNVYAIGSLNGETPLEYGNTTYAYNWSSSTSWTSLSLTRPATDVPYHTPYVTTGTYGISFGQFLNGILLPKHYYRITWVAANGGGTNCAGPNSWANQLRTGTGMGNSVQVTRTYFNFIGIQNNQQVIYDDGSVETGVCAYTIVTAFAGNVSWLNFPVNTPTSLNQEWFYHGYYIEDIGSTDTVSNSELQTAITNMQNSINSNANTNTQNIINNNNTNTQNIINNQNQNAQQAHQDAQNTQNTIKDDTVDSNTGKSFFDGFSDNTHGLSGIITAPLNIIQSLINVNPTNCSDLSTTYHGKTISMKCGSIFWGHTGFTEFNTFYNLVVGGAFCYLIIKDLFLTIEKMKDPDNDKVEVMDL